MGGSSSCPLPSSAPTSPFTCQTDLEMEFSRASHFSVLDESATSSNWSAEANYEYFAELQNNTEYGGFFLRQVQEIRVGKKISHGAQADIYEARVGEKGEFNLVVKVMKGNDTLQAFQAQWPIELFSNMELFNILGGVLLEEERFRGRFAFVMYRRWGDLRLLIDRRMKARRCTNGPFSINQAIHLMLKIAKDMDILHKHDILHRDLKASNVLVSGVLVPRRRNSHRDIIGDEVMLRDDYMLNVVLADFESSRFVMGTSFWRAPEIFQQLKDGVPSAEVTFTIMADVYSYGMTCYEIVTGRIPFDSEYEPCTRDEVLIGRRPTLPSEVPLFLRNIIERCWHPDPEERPNFYEIQELLEYKPKTPNLLECRQSHPTSVVIDNEIHESATLIKVEQWRHCLALTLFQVMEDLACMEMWTLRASTTSTSERIVYNLEVVNRDDVKRCDTTNVARIERAFRTKMRKAFHWHGRYIQNDVIKQTYVLEVTMKDTHHFRKFLEICRGVGLQVLKAEKWVGNGCMVYAMVVHGKEDFCVNSLLKGLAGWVLWCYIVLHKLDARDVDIQLDNFKRVMASFCSLSIAKCPFEQAMHDSSRELKYVPLEEGNIRHTDAIDVLRQTGYCSGLSSSRQWVDTSRLSSRQKPQHEKDLVKFGDLPLFFKIIVRQVTSISLRRRALQRMIFSSKWESFKSRGHDDKILQVTSISTANAPL